MEHACVRSPVSLLPPHVNLSMHVNVHISVFYSFMRDWKCENGVHSNWLVHTLGEKRTTKYGDKVVFQTDEHRTHAWTTHLVVGGVPEKVTPFNVIKSLLCVVTVNGCIETLRWRVYPVTEIDSTLQICKSGRGKKERSKRKDKQTLNVWKSDLQNERRKEGERVRRRMWKIASAGNMHVTYMYMTYVTEWNLSKWCPKERRVMSAWPYRDIQRNIYITTHTTHVAHTSSRLYTKIYQHLNTWATQTHDTVSFESFFPCIFYQAYLEQYCLMRERKLNEAHASNPRSFK
jgi:hypothetical protein